jgi:[acyl-carrier-protein] S-malonyltransferase
MLMKEAGVKRALILPVSVPSHCSLMKDAAINFKHSVDNINFQMGSERVLHNVDADFSSNIEQIKSKLVEQLYKPVHWTSIVQRMNVSGVEKLIEAGPGKVLAGLTRRIDKSLSGSAIIDATSLKSMIEEISNA